MMVPARLRGARLRCCCGLRDEPHSIMSLRPSLSVYMLTLRCAEYEGLIRMTERQRNVNEPIPAAFIRCLAGLEDFINASIAKEKSASKKMKAPNAKAMNGMKQKIKKSLAENDAQVQAFRKVSCVCCVWSGVQEGEDPAQAAALRRSGLPC
jgi:hypothetical protein